MRNILVISLVFLLSMVCHAQKIATSELNGTKWKEISPTYDYCERGMTFTMDTRTTNTKFYKTGKEFNCPLKYYTPNTQDGQRSHTQKRRSRKP